ncbi:unnamed protein product [Sphacelaria rigidula]
MQFGTQVAVHTRQHVCITQHLSSNQKWKFNYRR